jgi:Holliday junction resolvasome RuvABC ATP-dependent DNA helicase subunit
MQRVVLPWPRPLTQNEVRRLHHYAEATRKKELKLQARAAIRAAQLSPATGPVAVIFTHRPADRRRRDTDGPAPALKAALDALVDEGIDEFGMHEMHLRILKALETGPIAKTRISLVAGRKDEEVEKYILPWLFLKIV